MRHRAVGTLYPLLLETVGGPKISVGPPYFNATFVPLMVPLLIAVPVGAMLAGKRGDLAGVRGRLRRRWRSRRWRSWQNWVAMPGTRAGGMRHGTGRLGRRGLVCRTGREGLAFRGSLGTTGKGKGLLR